MKLPQLPFILCLGTVLLLQSCLISRQPQEDLYEIDRDELYAMRTVNLPIFIARPVVKVHLKKESGFKELLSYVDRIRAVHVTLASIRPGFDLDAFTTMATKAPYQNWINLNAYGNRLYINAVEKNNTIRKINIVVTANNNALVYAMVKCKLSPEDLSDIINLLISDEKRLDEWMQDITAKQ